ncbi:hypothetical protein DSECCO2_99700 [anaerobic digester metagenome]
MIEMKCPKCQEEANKAGKMNRSGKEVQRYTCRACGYVFWEGQELREMGNNPPCPKCQASTQKYGTGFKAGQTVRKYRCGSCGHVFLGDGPVEE